MTSPMTSVPAGAAGRRHGLHSVWGLGRHRYGRLSILLEQRRQEARTDCADWRTWSLSAWLASRGGA